jgi:hypothetical protein
MKKLSFRIVPLAVAAVAMLLIGTGSARAQVVAVRIGPPAPPVVVEHPWGRPYPGAVWIRPHHEWINGAWVWVHGYYAYPPHPGAVWIEGRWRHGYWRPGHWR